MKHRQLSRIFATRVAIKPNYSVTYTREITPRFISTQRPKHNTANGSLSEKACQRIKVRANWLLYLSSGLKLWSKHKRKYTPCKLVFITLTLSRVQTHSDRYITAHLLQPMLKWMQRQYGCHLYMWKAEVQPERWYKRKERCIHYHITTNRFIHYSALRNKWNALQKLHGYLNENNTSPSTEIRGVYSTKGFGSYMAKYFSKKETDDALKVTCKVWGCSRALSNMNVTVGEDLTDNFHDAMIRFTRDTSHGEKKLKHATIHFTSLMSEKKVPLEILEAVAVQRDAVIQKINASAAGRRSVPEGGAPAAVKPLVRWMQSELFPS